MITLSAGNATAVLAPEQGGRIASLRVDDVELLVTEGEREFRWGIFPMAPFAGRVANGQFRFRGVEYVLPPRLDGHAMHGTVLDRPWVQVDAGTVSIPLSDPWPFGGRVEHAVTLENGALHATLRLRANDAMPATLGWHPWFRRRLDRGSAANLALVADRMYERRDKLPTGELIDPTPPPWDDCFTGIGWPVTIRWPGFGTLEVSSDCTHVVVYDEERDALCVEPQTGPPNAMNNGGGAVVDAGGELVARMTLRWTLGS